MTRALEGGELGAVHDAEGEELGDLGWVEAVVGTYSG